MIETEYKHEMKFPLQRKYLNSKISNSQQPPVENASSKSVVALFHVVQPIPTRVALSHLSSPWAARLSYASAWVLVMLSSRASHSVCSARVAFQRVIYHKPSSISTIPSCHDSSAPDLNPSAKLTLQPVIREVTPASQRRWRRRRHICFAATIRDERVTMMYY